MNTYRFRKLDAFTSGVSTGNPAGCIFVDSPGDMSEADMQRIARELSGFVSEVGCVWPVRDRDWAYEMRFFSCEREVDFCGHVTVAIMHDLLRRNGEKGTRGPVRIRTRAGLLEVENRIDEENLVFIQAPEPCLMEPPVSADQTAAALNLDGGGLDAAGPFGFVNAGLNTLLVGSATLSACIGCRPDYATLRHFCLENGIDIVTIYSRETSCALNAFRTRVFAPAFGYLEDPATGSGSAALGHLMEASGLLPGERLRIEQGTSRESPNIIHLKKTGARLSIGGQSVCRIEGTYTLF